MAKTAKQRRLGRGLSSLIGESQPVAVTPPESPDSESPPPTEGSPTQGRGANAPYEDAEGLRRLKLDEIIPNRRQPRQRFDDAALKALADSIRTAGVMQPIAVRPIAVGSGGEAVNGAKWELIAGER
ncbi:MAG: ParB N-terminal domain-containing protein, partial [Planctomycetota bacterium]|nr:ParB N-terminal domain-containing protein [Planctomycetota bacterium]